MNQKQNNSKGIVILLVILILILIITIITYFFANQIATRTMKSNQSQITSQLVPQSINDLKIVYFSDVDYDQFSNASLFEQFSKQISQQEVNVLIFGGDLVSGTIDTITPQQEEQLISTLKSLRASSGKFAILGDDDLKTPEIESSIRRIFKESGFEVLDNTSRKIFTTTNNEYITLIGVSSFQKERADIQTAFSQVAPDSFKIVIAHEPDSFDELVKYNVQLQLSGHAHGGQVNLPFFDPLINKPWAQKYLTGSHTQNQSHLVISDGIGIEKAYFRLFTNNGYLNIQIKTTP